MLFGMLVCYWLWREDNKHETNIMPSIFRCFPRLTLSCDTENITIK